MKKTEAMVLMKKGIKMSHRSFTDDEWVTYINNFMMLTEEGYFHEENEFWRWRTDEAWDEDWNIWEDSRMTPEILEEVKKENVKHLRQIYPIDEINYYDGFI